VGIHFTADDGQTWNLAVAETANTGEYDWHTPYVKSKRCRVSVFDVAVPAFDVSDRTFWIYQYSSDVPPNFRITAADFYPAAPTQTRPGDPLVISALVENLGLIWSGPAWLEIWGSRTGGLTLDYLLCEARAAVDLAANPRTLYAAAPTGACMILCFPDRPDFVNETDESDNVAAIAGCLIVP